MSISPEDVLSSIEAALDGAKDVANLVDAIETPHADILNSITACLSALLSQFEALMSRHSA